MLFWNWQISQGVTVPCQYFWGLLSGAAFRNSLHGALPPTIGWSFLLAGSSPTGSEGPASTTICASCLVGENPGNCPISSSFHTSSLLFSISPRAGGLWCYLGLHQYLCLSLWLCLGLCPCPCPSLLLPTSSCDLGLCHAGMENQPIRGLGRLFWKLCTILSFTKQVWKF